MPPTKKNYAASSVSISLSARYTGFLVDLSRGDLDILFTRTPKLANSLPHGCRPLSN